MSDCDESRRRFCQLAGLTLIGAALPACGDGSSMEDMSPRACSPTLSFFTSVNVADVMPGTARLILTPQTRFFLCRDDKGIYAVDAACTHKGTDVNFVSAEAGFSCPLHGATFNFNGENPGAPATEPLPHYLVCTTASGTIVVDTEQPVPAGVRYRV